MRCSLYHWSVWSSIGVVALLYYSYRGNFSSIVVYAGNQDQLLVPWLLMPGCTVHMLCGFFLKRLIKYCTFIFTANTANCVSEFSDVMPDHWQLHIGQRRRFCRSVLNDYSFNLCLNSISITHYDSDKERKKYKNPMTRSRSLVLNKQILFLIICIHPYIYIYTLQGDVWSISCPHPLMQELSNCHRLIPYDHSIQE